MASSKRVSPILATSTLPAGVAIPELFAGCHVSDLVSVQPTEPNGDDTLFLTDSDPFTLQGRKVIVQVQFTRPLVPVECRSASQHHHNRPVPSMECWQGEFHGEVASVDYAAMTCRALCRNDAGTVTPQFTELKGRWEVELVFQRSRWRLRSIDRIESHDAPMVASGPAALRRPRAKRCSVDEAGDHRTGKRRRVTVLERKSEPVSEHLNVVGHHLLRVDELELINSLQEAGQHAEAIAAVTRALEHTVRQESVQQEL